MSNNKQSSVEFILDNLHLKDSLKWTEIIQQAKAMHEEEIENAYDDGWHHSNENYYNPVGNYNETFNNEQQ